jgi:chaperone modulatory protein CbpM
MQQDLIIVAEYCNQYNVDVTFIDSLEEYGLITITTIETQRYFPSQQAQDIERYIHLHYELEINMEGIEAISHLLQKIETLQHEIAGLQDRLRIREA